MSQNLKSISLISHDSGLKDLILRPLSAKRLPETLPEKECWVMREKLLGLSGRSRKPQIELANKFGIKEYPAPAGGCLLTDVIFSRRLRDLIVHDPNFSKRDIELLKLGRHFRINKGGKIIVGRDQRENEMITSLIVKGDTVFSVDSFPGPTVLVTGVLSNEEIQLAASITVSYSDAGIGQLVLVQVKKDSKRWKVLARGKEKSNFHQLMI